MSTVRTSPSFVDRFERMWSSLRATRIVAAVAGLVVLLAVGLAALAVADYAWELDWSRRAMGLAIAVTLLPLGVIAVVVRKIAGWDRPRTAAELERRHPELGQSVRTTVQFRNRTPEQLLAMGVAPSMVAALEAETGERTEPIPFDELVPRGVARTLIAVALVAVAAVLVPTRFDWEWRTAVNRALLTETPYTTVESAASADRVEAEQNVGVTIDVHGRTPDEVTFQWRNVGEEDWRELILPAADATIEGTTATYEVTVERLDEPIEFRALAGAADSDIGRVDVHYPIEVESFSIHVEPPEYTGLEAATVPGGSVEAIHGSRLRFEVELDQTPATAELVLTGTKAGPKQEMRIPFEIDGTTLSADLVPDDDVYFRVAATAEDGTKLDEPKYRLRVRYDQPPRIWFEEPYDVIEVHALAEVLMRIRVQDDFGVARAGIVFEVNNEEEYELLGREFEEAIDDLVEASGSTRRTAAVLERVLPLEHFELTQKDSVAYYAYVEDNYPDRPHRVETELRFVDVRPFRRRFRLREDMPGGGGNGAPRIPSLDQIITQQRVGLNRTMRQGKRADQGEEVGIDAVERMIAFQNDLATETRRLAEFLQAREIEGNDSLFQAEERMLVAVDSIAVGNFETSSLQQKDALRYLIDARDKLEITLNGQNNVIFTELMRFARRQAQSMRRRNRGGEEEQQAEDIIERLLRLADTERSVAGDLGRIVAMAAEPAGDPAPTDPMDPMDDEMPAAGPSLEEVVEIQVDVGLEARDIERILSTLRGVSDLAKERIGAAASMAEGVSGSIDQGETDEAIAGAERAAEAFDELARNIEGLLARESADKVGVAADIARDIADRQRAIASADPEADPEEANPAGGGGEESMDDESMDEEAATAAFTRELERAAESGRTLLDVLEAIPANATREDDMAVGQIEQLLDEEQPREAIERMQALAAGAGGEEPEEVREQAGGLAREMDATAERLTTIRQRVVEPRVRQLMDLEARAAELERELEDLETQEDISGWHREADELVEKLEAAGLVEDAREELEDAMRGQGWERERPEGWTWSLTEDAKYVAPESYEEGLRSIERDLQQQIRELILRERSSDADERTPPAYRPLVNRYFKVLTRGLDEEEAE